MNEINNTPQREKQEDSVKQMNSIDKVFSKPVKIISPLFLYILGILTLFGFIFLNNVGELTRNKIAPVVIDSAGIPDELEILEPRTASAIDIKLLKEPSEEMIAKGMQSYNSACASCHGAGGKGDGVAGGSLNPKPRDFTNPEGWKNSPKVSGMYLTLQKGIPGGGMTAYDFMPAEERVAIIQFIRKQFTVNAPNDSDAELAELDKTYKLSEGTKQPGQITVKAATDLLLDSLKSKNSVVKEFGARGGNTVFNYVTLNKNKALGTLINNNSWRGSKESLLKVMSSNPVSNGFKNNIFALTQDEIAVLYNYLLGLKELN